MNINSALRVVVMEELTMVPILCISIQLLVLQSCRHFIPMPPCSCLVYGISVGEKVFISVCDCSLPHVYVQTILYQH